MFFFLKTFENIQGRRRIPSVSNRPKSKRTSKKPEKFLREFQITPWKIRRRQKSLSDIDFNNDQNNDVDNNHDETKNKEQSVEMKVDDQQPTEAEDDNVLVNIDDDKDDEYQCDYRVKQQIKTLPQSLKNLRNRRASNEAELASPSQTADKATSIDEESSLSWYPLKSVAAPSQLTTQPVDKETTSCDDDDDNNAPNNNNNTVNDNKITNSKPQKRKPQRQSKKRKKPRNVYFGFPYAFQSSTFCAQIILFF